MLNLLEQLVQGVVTLVEGFVSMLKWAPITISFTNAAFAFIPAVLLPCALITVVVYLLKLFLGGDNS